MADKKDEPVIATNRKALFNYHVLERAEAGLALVGSEVKSIREGGLNFKDAYVESPICSVPAEMSVPPE